MSTFYEMTEVDQSSANRLSFLHGLCFMKGWTAEDFIRMGDDGSRRIFVFRHDTELIGLAVFSAVCDEAEILSVCIAPEFRNKGNARALLTEAFNQLSGGGIERFFLEVSAANSAAIALYQTLRFEVMGRRKNYYLDPDGRRQDALTMCRTL